MKKNDKINSKQRATTVQFKNAMTNEKVSHTFFGTEQEVSEQIDDFMAKNPNMIYVQSFAGIMGLIGCIIALVCCYLFI